MLVILHFLLNLTVDTLVLCNEQIIRGSSEENVNASHPSSDVLTNVSKGRDHGTASFPFVEGTPFTASLWVGLEGFHMTVNGRHETSFAYREVRYELLIITDDYVKLVVV